MTTEKKFLRTVRSYMRRTGRMSMRQQQAYEQYWPYYGLDISNGFLHFANEFNREALTFLEIGFGMGKSLLSMAIQRPQHNFIGVEVHHPGVCSLLADMAEQHVNNIRIFCADANDVLKHAIPDFSLQGIYIFFADPWPKKRHHKRRLIQPAFVDILATKLIDGGHVHLATDWQDYAQHMLEVFSANKLFENRFKEKNFAPVGFNGRPQTKYEQRGQRLGHEVWDLVFDKVKHKE